MKATIKRTTFKSCGLDAANGFLSRAKCDCGCGGFANPIINNRDELCEFMSMLLADHDCEHCAIFAVNADGSATVGIKTDGKITFMETTKRGKCIARRAIREMQEEFEFHCYGLLEQATENTYCIIVD